MTKSKVWTKLTFWTKIKSFLIVWQNNKTSSLLASFLSLCTNQLFQDIELFNGNEAVITNHNTSDYFTLTKKQSNLRLPQFGEDDILVKPSTNNNWILLPTTEFLRAGTLPSNSSNSGNGNARLQSRSTDEENSKLMKAWNSLRRFIGPTSSSTSSVMPN